MWGQSIPSDLCNAETVHSAMEDLTKRSTNRELLSFVQWLSSEHVYTAAWSSAGLRNGESQVVTEALDE